MNARPLSTFDAFAGSGGLPHHTWRLSGRRPSRRDLKSLREEDEPTHDILSVGFSNRPYAKLGLPAVQSSRKAQGGAL